MTQPSGELDLDDFDLSLPEGQSRLIQFLYFLANGSLSRFETNQPDEGLMGLVNARLSDFNEILSENQITNCIDITENVADITSGNFRFEFSDGGSSLPSYFDLSEGSSFDRSFTVFENNTRVFEGEFLCPESGELESLRLRLNVGTRQFLAFVQSSDVDSSLKVDFYMTRTSEKLALRFETADGNLYSLTLIHALGDEPAAIAVAGTRSDNLVRAGIRADRGVSVTNIDTTVAEAWTETCLDLDTTLIDGGCQQAIVNELTSSQLAGNGSWTIANTHNMSLPSL